MSYASKDDLIAAAGDYRRFRELVDSRQAPPEESDSVDYWVRQAQRAGDSLIDTILQPRFATPLAAPSEAIRFLAAQEGIYYLASSVGMATEAEYTAHEERVQTLEAMRDGKRSPSHETPTPTSNQRGAIVERTGAWSRRGMKGFA